MFTLQVGFMSPSFVGIVPSIEMVIFCAVGGRLSLLGAVYGSLLVNWAKTTFSESFPELWLFAMGALFIGVVLAFPNGIAGLFQKYIEPYMPSWYSGKKSAAKPESTAKESVPETTAAAAATGKPDTRTSVTNPAPTKSEPVEA